jgi:predicted phage tail protein
MLRTVKVYGHLAEHCGQSVFEALVRTPAEAIRFLLCNFPELRGLMRDGYYKVAASDLELELTDHPEQLHYPLGTNDVVRVIPVITGAGGGTGKILLGAALIGLSAVSFGAGSLFAGSFGVTGIGAAIAGTTTGLATGSIALLGIGASLVLGGVADLITPVPKAPDIDNDPRENFNFSGIQNVSREGVPVPIVYGEMVVGSVVVSAGLNTEEK